MASSMLFEWKGGFERCEPELTRRQAPEQQGFGEVRPAISPARRHEPVGCRDGGEASSRDSLQLEGEPRSERPGVAAAPGLGDMHSLLDKAAVMLSDATAGIRASLETGERVTDAIDALSSLFPHSGAPSGLARDMEAYRVLA